MGWAGDAEKHPVTSALLKYVAVGKKGHRVTAEGLALDAAISALEAKLRKPGFEEDYRRLSRAYRTRYERTGEMLDLERSVASLEKAETLKVTVPSPLFLTANSSSPVSG